jgi:hypothetical protein
VPQRHFCPSQNPTWPDPGLNPGRRGGKPATNRLSYGAALSYWVSSYLCVPFFCLLFFLCECVCISVCLGMILSLCVCVCVCMYEWESVISLSWAIQIFHNPNLIKTQGKEMSESWLGFGPTAVRTTRSTRKPHYKMCTWETLPGVCCW